jgi:hypothetical protein
MRVSQVLPKMSRFVEIVLALLLLGACFVQTARTMHAMATTSLWTDEYGTVGTFSSKGPKRVLTDYRTAKNHIFFNLLNSILPKNDSVDPLRVRLLSILAGGIFFVVLVAYALWRGALFEGAVVLTLWTFALDSLSLVMEARGYGFLVLAGLLSFIGVVEYFRSDRRHWLFMAAGAVVLGVYTVPGFLFFGGPLLLFVWLARRNKLTFFVGAAAALAILALYSPVATQLVKAFQVYGDRYGEDFKGGHSLLQSLNLYLFVVPAWASVLFLIVLGVTPFLVSIRRPELRGLAVVMGGTFAFFAVLLYLGTSPIRMSNMGWVPFALAGVFALGAAIRSMPMVVRLTCFTATGLGLLWGTAPTISHFKFTPQEDWVLAGQVIDHAFPPSMRVDYLNHAKYLLYTINDPKGRSASFDEKDYLAGRLVVADAANRHPNQWSRGQEFLRPEDEPHKAVIEMPAGGRSFFFTFQLPSASLLAAVPPELVDRDVKTGLDFNDHPFTMQTPVLQDGQSVVFLLSDYTDADATTFSARDISDGSDHSKDAIHAGNSIILPIRGGSAEPHPYELKLQTKDRSLKIVESWITPASRK